jgi:succinate dehydrogenase hydrophobic anchor subunit
MQRITGALLVLLLILHFWVEHFSADVRTHDLSWELVQRRFFHNPWFLWVDISFLLVALYHGLYGLRNILFDYSVISRSPALRRGTVVVLWVAGLVWAWWGVGAFYGNNKFFHPASEKQPVVVKSEANLAAAR